MDDLPISDLELLQRFSRKRDEGAFETLVVRYANLVFGVALRKGVGREGAEDVTQKVFAVLARKAKRLTRKGSLAGWLSRTASLEATYLRRTESNRRRKMDNYQQSGALPDLDNGGVGGDEALWRAALPHLDEVMADLPPGDQEVVLQRFYNGQTFAAIAAQIDKSEAAVQKQSRRALDKMSKLLKRRGIAVPAAALASALTAELAKAAPATASTALSQGALSAAQGITGATILTNTLETMAYAKTKTALVVAAVAAIPTGMQWSKINQLESRLDSRPTQVAPNIDPGVLAGLKAEVADLKEQLLVAKAAASEPAAVSALATKTAGPPRGDKPPGLAGIAEMFEDPGMREMMKTQMKSQIGMMYGDFITDLELDPKKRGELEDLFVDRQMELAAKGIKAMGPGDEEGREAMTAAREEYDEKLKDMLGDEQFAHFQRYEDSSPERMELKSYTDSLARGGLGELTYEQEEKLMGIMYEERQAFQFSSGFSPNQNDVPQWKPSEETTSAVVADYAKLQSQIAARVGEVLNTDQVASFQANQESFLKMTEAGLRMSQQMFGGGEGAEAE